MLDPEKVRRGMKKETDHMCGRGVCEKVERGQASANPEKMVTRPQWEKTKKGDELRCRFVA